MPSFIQQMQNLKQNGPVIPVKVWLAKPIRELLVQQNKTLPQPIQINALIDSGASNTSISPRVTQQLGLIPHGLTHMLTAGKPTLVNVYDVNIDIGIPFKTQIIFDPISVAESPLSGQINIDCLIGRDILSKGVFIYIGYVNTFSFSI